MFLLCVLPAPLFMHYQFKQTLLQASTIMQSIYTSSYQVSPSCKWSKSALLWDLSSVD